MRVQRQMSLGHRPRSVVPWTFDFLTQKLELASDKVEDSTSQLRVGHEALGPAGAPDKTPVEILGAGHRSRIPLRPATRNDFLRIFPNGDLPESRCVLTEFAKTDVLVTAAQLIHELLEVGPSQAQAPEPIERHSHQAFDLFRPLLLTEPHLC